MSMDPSEAGSRPNKPEARYPLYLDDSNRRFFFKLRDRDIWLNDDGVRWMSNGRVQSLPWRRLEKVRLLSAFVPRMGTQFVCTLGFGSGLKLRVKSVDAWGRIAGAQESHYRAFVLDLHERLAARGAGQVRFLAGVEPNRHRLMWFALVPAIAFFGVLPIVLWFVIRRWEAFALMLGSLAFVWPLVTAHGENRQREYDPRHPPRELIP